MQDERVCMSRVNMCIFFNSIRRGKTRKNLKSLAYIHIGAAIHIERGRDWKENERQTDKKRKETGLDLSVKTLLSLTVVVRVQILRLASPFKPTRFLLSSFSCCCCCCYTQQGPASSSSTQTFIFILLLCLLDGVVL